MYSTFVWPNFGKNRISTLKKSVVKRFYNALADDRGLQASVIDGVHTVLHQALQIAAYSSYLRSLVSHFRGYDRDRVANWGTGGVLLV